MLPKSNKQNYNTQVSPSSQMILSDVLVDISGQQLVDISGQEIGKHNFVSSNSIYCTHLHSVLCGLCF